MIPLALGTGPGAEERRSIAIVVIGGQTLSLLLTLVATPVFYTIFEDVAQSERWKSIVLKVSVPVRALGRAASEKAGRVSAAFRARSSH